MTKHSTAPSKSGAAATRKRLTLIQQMTSGLQQEAQSYAPLKNLLTDAALGIGLPPGHVIVDSRLPSGCRPDLQIWLEGVPADLRNEHEHLYAVIEVKAQNKAELGGEKLAREELATYRRARLSYFWLVDAGIVKRYDLAGSADLPPPQTWTWRQLEDDQTFKTCFVPLLPERRHLRRWLEAFATLETLVGEPVTAERRQEFTQSIVTVARLLSRAVSELVDRRLIPDLKTAKAKLAVLESSYGAATCDWAKGEEYLIFANEPKVIATRVETYGLIEAVHEFNQRYTDLIGSLHRYVYALRAETEHLAGYARRAGLNPEQASFLKCSDEAKSAREAFVQETATLLFSRMLMIRFSEDHGLLLRYLSNGGLAAFARYAGYFQYPLQKLVQEAYENAQPLYQHLFERKPLDWVVESNDPQLGDEILHALWILARWDFKTVRGDLLSGVYDRYLEPRQRKRLGEIYTRPELARYLLRACGWTGEQQALDPACGSGTFLVEAFDQVLNAREQSGIGFDPGDVQALLERLHGLDLNEFSATLAKIQLLWHVLAALKGQDESTLVQTIQALRIEGGHDALDTWGLPMRADDLLSDAARAHVEYVESRNGKSRRLKAPERRFRNISANYRGYDIVVGNPPYVRIHRIAMAEEVKAAYAEITHKQTDLSAFFVYRALRWWLKPGGRMALFLPLALTEAAYAQRLRQVVDEYRLVEIVDLELLGNVAFHGANVVTIALVVENSPPGPDDEVTLTTVDAACYDRERNTVDMTQARQARIRRDAMHLNKYLPKTSADQAMADEGDDEEAGETGETGETADTGWLTKLQPGDAPLLDKLARHRRLADLVQVAYEKRTREATIRVAEIPEDQDAGLWKPRFVMGYGVKIGGKAPNQPDGLPILKGGDTFSDGVDGEPLGRWNGSAAVIDTVRFYGWRSLFAPERTYVCRDIALQPVIAPHPAATWLQNTVYIFQLAVDFPLNIYVLSRPVAWFMVRLHRASAIQQLWCHWIPRHLLRIPIPADPAALADPLTRIGRRIFQLDHELAAGDRLFDQYRDPHQQRSRALRHAPEWVTSGAFSKPLEIAYPQADADWTGAQAVIVNEQIRFVLPAASLPDQPAPTASGEPCEIQVADPRLRRWVLWLANDLLENGGLPSATWVRDLPIPDDLDAVNALLDRLEHREAEQDLATALAELDAVVAEALGLTDSERDYIVRQMQTDSFLAQLRPAWRHRVGRRKVYKAYGGEKRY